jgi:ABC-2 type transport system permease protein
MIDAAPVMCALIISVLAFIFTLFKTNGYLFNFREYDMLMSLPFEARTIAGCKLLYMYIKSLPWYLTIAVSMMIGYGIFARPSWTSWPVWMILSLLLPVIPMLCASFLGFLIARISAGFRKTNIVQTVLTLVFIVFCFSLRFIVEDVGPGMPEDNEHLIFVPFAKIDDLSEGLGLGLPLFVSLLGIL